MGNEKHEDLIGANKLELMLRWSKSYPTAINSHRSDYVIKENESLFIACNHLMYDTFCRHVVCVVPSWFYIFRPVSQSNVYCRLRNLVASGNTRLLQEAQWVRV